MRARLLLTAAVLAVAAVPALAASTLSEKAALAEAVAILQGDPYGVIDADGALVQLGRVEGGSSRVHPGPQERARAVWLPVALKLFLLEPEGAIE